MLIIVLHSIYLLTICIAGSIGWAVYKKIQPGYRPIILFFIAEMWFALIEFFSGNSLAVRYLVNTVQPVLGLLLLCWQAAAWNLYGRKRKIFYIVLAVAAACFGVGILLTGANPVRWLNVYTDIAYVLIGVEMIRRSLLIEEDPDYQRPVLFTGFGLLTGYIISMVLGLFVPLGDITDQDYLGKVYLVYIPFCIIANVLFICAVRRLPRWERVVENEMAQ